MSFNGSGSFLINTAGQPVVSGTVISSTAFNALTADLATGLSTCITKDGQTTVTANIPMANYKFTGLGAGSGAADSANLSQVQSTVVKLLASVSGTDTITAVGSPTVAAYAAGQMFYFVAAGDNTGAVTINIDSLGAKAVTRDGSVALVAGDIKSGEVVVIVYDGTRFQVVSQLNSSGDARFANVSITSALNVGGVATFTGNPVLSGGTANGVLYLNGSKVATSGSALTFDGTNLGVGTTSPASVVAVAGSTSTTLGFSVSPGGWSNARHRLTVPTSGDESVWSWNYTGAALDSASYGTASIGVTSSAIKFSVGATNTAPSEGMRLNSTGLGIGTTSPATRLDVRNTASTTGSIVNIANSSSSAAGNIVPIRFFTGNSFGGLEQCAAIWGINPNAGTNNGGALVFATSANGTATTPSERVRIVSGGAVGINYTAPQVYGQLTVSWDVTATSVNNNTGLAIRPEADTSDAYFVLFYNSGGSGIGSIRRVGTTNAVAYNTTSDRRLKENITPASDAGAVVDAIDVVQYDWKDGPHINFGVIAQDLHGVAPEAVSVGDGDDVEDVKKPWGVDYSKLVPMLVKEIQSLRARVAALEAK